VHDPVLTAAAQRADGAAELNDYPTPARADYVFACMKMNGDTRKALEKCFCSIDVIASILPYEPYVAAETFFSLSQVPGRFGTMFQSPEQARAATKRPQTRPRRRRGTLFWEVGNARFASRGTSLILDVMVRRSGPIASRCFTYRLISCTVAGSRKMKCRNVFLVAIDQGRE
jgi:hypothetical protein